MMRLRVSLDLDNVIRDSIGAIINLMHQRYGRTIDRAMFDQWDPQIGPRVGIPQYEFFQLAWVDPAVSKLALPIKGAKEVLEDLNTKAFIIINTNNPYPDITYDWLKLWQIPHHAVEHTTNKATIDFDVHVDDSPLVLEQLFAAGRQVVRYSLPWNNHLNGVYPVVADWQQLGQLLNGYISSGWQGIDLRTGIPERAVQHHSGRYA